MSLFLKRNLKLYFRDKSAVFFSLLAVFIIIGLYATFLGDAWLSGELKGLPDAEFLMNSWLLSGLLSVASVTTTMGAFGVMIDDKVKKIDYDFYASPVKKSRLTAGYLGSALAIGIIMSFVTFAVVEAYILLRGGRLPGPAALCKSAGLILLATMANTSLVCFMASFFKSQQAFGTASTIIGTLIGFLTGIYMPIGSLPASVQTVIKAFPISHSAVLFRQVLMQEPLSVTFAGADAYVAGFKEFMGVTYSFGGETLPPWASV
ncbi:MAG TPA: ABC transporter permease, partial [Terriglobales bacterium]|nr:ABC transporter permease [Terriglobales bacterium]